MGAKLLAGVSVGIRDRGRGVEVEVGGEVGVDVALGVRVGEEVLVGSCVGITLSEGLDVGDHVGSSAMGWDDGVRRGDLGGES